MKKKGFPVVALAGLAAAAAVATAAPAWAHAAGAPGWACAAIAAAAMGAAAFSFAPALGEAMASRQQAALDAWSIEALARYAAFVDEHGRRPSRASRDSRERAAALFEADALRLAREGELPRATARAIAVLGGPISAERAAEMPEDPYAANSARDVPVSAAAALAALCALAAAALCLSFGFGGLGAGAGRQWLMLCALGVSAAMAVCDMKSTALPPSWSAFLWTAGAGAALLAGTAQLAAWAATAAFWAAALLIGRLAFSALGRPAPIGAGDLLMAPAVAAMCGPQGALFGLAACTAAMAAFYLPRLADRRLSPGDRVEMAPFLHVWLACGLAWPAVQALI